MKQTLYKFFFFMLLGIAWPDSVGAELSRSVAGNESYVEQSRPANIHDSKKKSWKKYRVRWKKVSAGNLVGAFMLSLLLIGAIALIVAAVNGGGGTLGILGFLLSLFFLFLLIKILKTTFKQKNKSSLPESKTENIPVKNEKQKSGLVFAIVLLVIGAFFFGVFGLAWLLVAILNPYFVAGAVASTVIFAILALLISAACIRGIIRASRKIHRLKHPETIPEELPRRPPSRNLKHQ